MFYSVYKLDRTLLVHVRTMYSTCHKLNESFDRVRERECEDSSKLKTKEFLRVARD